MTAEKQKSPQCCGHFGWSEDTEEEQLGKKQVINYLARKSSCQIALLIYTQYRYFIISFPVKNLNRRPPSSAIFFAYQITEETLKICNSNWNIVKLHRNLNSLNFLAFLFKKCPNFGNILFDKDHYARRLLQKFWNQQVE